MTCKYAGCTGLTSVTIPENIYSIGDAAFWGCTGLTSITIPNSVNAIGYQAFYGCTSLSSIIIPSSVSYIGKAAFIFCKALTSITIPGSVTSIGSGTFANCKSLVSVTISQGVKSIGGDNLDGGAFGGCSALTSIIIPNSVTSIGNQAFLGCSNLKTVDIGSGIKSIGSYAFMNCPEMSDVYCYAENVPGIGSDVFKNSYIEYATLHVPAESVEAYRAVQPWKTFKMIKNIMPRHTLTYIVDGEVYKSFRVEEDAAITPEPEAKKEGYTFSGWSEFPETMPAHDVIITGTFTINKYKLTYQVDGEEYKSYELDYGTNITPEPTPAKENYTFSGWSEIPMTMPAYDVTVIGTFAINKYKLTYIVDGEEYKSYELDFSASITPEPSPAKEGYSFSGWNEIPNTMPAHDVTVIGSFSINKYKLIYIVDGEEYKSYELDFGTSITPETTPSKEGYTFSGWSDIPETMPAHDVTVIGTFTINKYKLTYTVDCEEYKSFEVEFGTNITPEPALTKEGYTFSGWSDIPETMPAHDVTISGEFSANSYFLFYVLDGGIYKALNVKYGTEIIPEIVPEKDGYTFSGWANLPQTMPANDITIQGKYYANKYDLIYKVDGEVFNTVSIEYNSTLTQIDAPTKDGYTFSGWSEIPATMPAHDVVVTGSFAVNSYSVTFQYGDIVFTTTKVEYGSAIPLPESLDSDRYTLVEWLDVPTTMPAYDITIYADFTDGVKTIKGNNMNAEYYQQNGIKREKLQRGINIIRNNDGTAKKVVVK